MTKPDSFQVDDIAVTIVRSARRKSLSIEVGLHGVKARAPKTMRHSTIVEFVRSKQNWLQKHLANLPEPPEPFVLTSGAPLLLQGEVYRLETVLGSTKPIRLAPSLESISSSIDDAGRIIVPVKTPISDEPKKLEASITNKLVRWYKDNAKTHIEERVGFYASLMQIPRNKSLDVKVRDYKRRWGSCDQHGGLSFNWRIIQAPSQVLDYVVIHELAHCHEFNHSKRFWAIVARQMPDWKQKQQWLHNNGLSLYKF